MKKLYKITLTHYSQKDYETGIVGYFIANKDKEIYDYIKSEPDGMYNSWSDYEDEDPDYAKSILENCGESAVREDFNDLYYGLTLYDWGFVNNVDENDIEVLIRLGVAKQI